MELLLKALDNKNFVLVVLVLNKMVLVIVLDD